LALPVNSSDSLLDYLGRQIESFLFFSNALGIQGRTNEQLFARWSAGLRHASDEEQIKAIVLETMVPYLREKLSDFRGAFPYLAHALWNPLYRQRIVLGRLENTMREQAGMSPHGHNFIQSLQIEHILPQTPRDGAIPSEFESKEDYKTVVARLGNVTLLESMINQAVNNINDLNSDWFERKQAEYVKSNLVMTNLLDPNYQIGKNTGLNRFREASNYRFEAWERDSVEARQKVLMSLALDTWTLCGERLDAARETA